ncbi:MAG: polyprenyl synthetase family protein [Acidobacteria bacterium]|nr:polyprenyl synthetase family protein [Acidobacteriota bacterium]
MPSVPVTLSEQLETRRLALEPHLDRLLPPESAPPETLHRAMRYAVLGGGKRIRPVLCIESAAVLSRDLDGIEDLACAVEFIHTYSLIHDDLPALDNDDLRRGRPTCHKVFGEAIAILAGDALLTLAFETLARMPRPAPAEKARLIAELADAIGTRDGMIAGQVADLEAEGQSVDAAAVEAIHRAKTAALIRAAVRAGARFAGAPDADLERLSRFGERLGLAFQIIDDILDVQSSPEELGKSTRRDAARRKATYPAVFGLERSRMLSRALIGEATAELAPFGPRAQTLRDLAHFLLTRTK